LRRGERSQEIERAPYAKSPEQKQFPLTDQGAERKEPKENRGVAGEEQQAEEVKDREAAKPFAVGRHRD